MKIEEVKSNIKFWESKRWIFNVLVGISGALGIYLGIRNANYFWSSSDTIGVIIYAVTANVFYSLGMIIELLDWYYLKNKIGISRFQLPLFAIGTIFSCLSTFLSAWMYFVMFW